MTVHCFDSSMDAYDACQSNENVKDGDVLIIEDEKIVALAWTWPVAVTTEYGALHTISDEGSVTGLMTDTKWTEEQVRAAVHEADKRGWSVGEKFLKHLGVVRTTITLRFPAGVSQERADEITQQVLEGINNDLETAGSDMWPGEVPVLETKS